jgi:hypothetical protein
VYERFASQAQFLLVYLREAHALDGWTKPNSQLTDPRTQAERELVAAQCCKELKLEFPALVDTMDDQTAVDWAAWPERIFVVGTDGRVAYAGEQGPWGFWPTDRVKRQAAQRNAAKGKNSKNSDSPKRSFDGDSLEKFLSHLIYNEPLVEVVEPRIVEGLFAP